MKKHFILATNNLGKVAELQALLGKNHNVCTLSDIKFFDEIIENGMTFEENALIKAKAIKYFASSNFNDYYILADDSGLIIDALEGRPGVDSANWLGADTSYEIKNRQILEMMANVPEGKRSAQFVTVIVCIKPNGQIYTTKGTLEGSISFEPLGNNGFGYDPIFFMPKLGCTLAQLSTEEKNHISHRAQALKNMLNLLLDGS